MATLTSAQVKEILLKRPGKDVVEDAQAMHKKLSMHINGLGLADYIRKIETYERPEHLALRKQYAQSNKALFARIARPIDEIYSARGGGRIYRLSSPELEKEFAGMMTEVEYGYSSKKWVECFWTPRYLDDPMGLIFIEVGADEAYPTYKSSHDIFDYKISGRKIEWVVFKTEDPDVFRVVDDSFDTLYRREGENVRKQTGTTYPNYFGRVPAIVISDIPKAGMEGIYVSPMDPVVELADEVLRTGSIRNIYSFKHGFPKTWKYREMCGDCKGTGRISANECRACNGTGKKVDSTPAEVTVLDWPVQGEPVIAPDVMGYVSPDIEYLKYSREELEWLETMIYKTHWGANNNKERQNLERETAAGVYMDVQPVNRKLGKYADSAEHVEKFIVDLLGEFYFRSDYKGATISYGRRYLLEGPDVIWKKYEDARKAGAPFSTLDEHLKEYYETKFRSNPLEMQRYLKQMRVEPFVHLTVDQCKAFTEGLDLARKAYFSEWAGTITEIGWITTPDQVLKDSLTAFAKARYEPIEKAEPGKDPEEEEDESKGDDNGGGKNNQLKTKGLDKTKPGAIVPPVAP